MTAAGSGAVFFLGTRAHYQVLQQPETRSIDLENGNTSEETVYQNPSVQQVWSGDPVTREDGLDADSNWGCYENGDLSITEEIKSKMVNGMKRRAKRRQSEATLCERDNEMRPALLNNISDCSSPKKPSRHKMSLIAFLTSLARRKRRLNSDQVQYLQHLETTLNCSYRESCRCLDCQSRYFECDESEGYSSDESDYTPQYVPQQPPPQLETQDVEDEDDEVFLDTAPDDNTSTDLLLDPKEPAKMSVSSDELVSEDDAMQLEVAAGTPVLLNYLLTHPITCAIQ